MQLVVHGIVWPFFNSNSTMTVSSHTFGFGFPESAHRLAKSQCHKGSISRRLSIPASNTSGTKTKKNKLYWHCLPKRKPDLSSKLESSCTSSGNRCRISKRFLLPAEVPGGSESIDEEIRVLKSLLPCIIPCCTSFAMTRNPSSWLWSWKLHARSAIHSDWLSTSASP